MSYLQGQIARVTGGSRWIGRAIALHLARAGAHVCFHSHRDREAAESISKEAAGARLVQANLRSMREIDQLARSLADTRLDIFINNAGVWGFTPLGSTTLESLETMLDVNVKAVFWLTQALLPLLNEGARIVN